MTAPLTEDEQEQYDERAAIMEFDGKLPREAAEQQALQQIFNNRKQNGK